MKRKIIFLLIISLIVPSFTSFAQGEEVTENVETTKDQELIESITKKINDLENKISNGTNDSYVKNEINNLRDMVNDIKDDNKKEDMVERIEKIYNDYIKSKINKLESSIRDANNYGSLKSIGILDEIDDIDNFIEDVRNSSVKSSLNKENYNLYNYYIKRAIDLLESKLKKLNDSQYVDDDFYLEEIEILRKLTDDIQNKSDKEDRDEELDDLFIDYVKQKIDSIEYSLKHDDLYDTNTGKKLLEETKDLRDLVRVKVNKMEDYFSKRGFAKELDKLSVDVEIAVYGGFKNIDIDEKIKDVEVKLERERYRLILPKLNKFYNYKVSIEDKTNNIFFIKDKITNDEYITLPKITEVTECFYKVDIINAETKDTLVTDEDDFTIEDTKRPEIERIYVIDEELFIDAYDNYGIKYYYYNINDEGFDRSSHDEIDLDEIPSEVEIKVKDLFGNETTTRVSVDEDNKLYEGDLTNRIEDKIDDERTEGFKDIDELDMENVIFSELNKEIEIFDEFDDYFEDEFDKRYDKEDTEFVDSDFKIDSDTNRILVEKEGISETEVYNEEEEETRYIYVISAKDFDIETGIDEIKNNLPYLINEDSIEFSDYLEFIPKKKIDKGDINTDFIVIKYKDRLYSIDDEINFDEYEDIYKFEIYNLETEEKIVHSLKHVQFLEKKDEFYDIRDHWAREYIMDMAKKGITNGYENNTFKPNNFITVKEFIAFLARVSIDEDFEIENTYDINLYKDDWAYYEVKSVLSKINFGKLLMSGLTRKYGNYITREEVAFLIANYYDMEYRASSRGFEEFKDLEKSKYTEDLKKLINENIYSGYSDNTIRPLNKITRAEALTILSKLN
ncbi:MAG: S-layer homology domain-containing protein [Firmicutes bacterium]|nr:S-layer homology domain-containing protein [Bacillota bacterium]